MLSYELTGNGENNIFVLHGLFGNINEFEFLKKLSNTRLCLIRFPGHDCGFMSFSQFLIELHNLFKQCQGPKHIYGYSMGGRVVLEYLKNYTEYFNSITLESCHFGGLKENEYSQKATFEEDLIARILAIRSEQGQYEFFDYWYDLSLFKNEFGVEKLKNNKSKTSFNFSAIASVIKEFSVIHQNRFIVDNLDVAKINYIVGELDLKYLAQAKQFATSMDIHIIPGAGHNIHSFQQDKVLKILSKCLK